MGVKFDFIQDQGLDVIAEGLDTLKHMAGDMNEVMNNSLYYFPIQFFLRCTCLYKFLIKLYFCTGNR